MPDPENPALPPKPSDQLPPTDTPLENVPAEIKRMTHEVDGDDMFVQGE